MSDFPKKCHICGMSRKSKADRPCQDKNKETISVKEKQNIEENCPAMIMMYA